MSVITECMPLNVALACVIWCCWVDKVDLLMGGPLACAEGMDIAQAVSSPQFSLAELTKAGNALAAATPWTEERAECLHASGMPVYSSCLSKLVTLAAAEGL